MLYKQPLECRYTFRIKLKAFARVSLKPHEKRPVQFQLAQDLSYWSSATHPWLIEPVRFDIWAGGDASNLVTMVNSDHGFPLRMSLFEITESFSYLA
jgi:hypothetical protein